MNQMKITIVNAFSANMLNKKPAQVNFQLLSLDDAKRLVIINQTNSAVGHKDTAALFSNILGVPVAENRCNVSLDKDSLLLGQYYGPRLPEGVTALPEGAEVVWYLVTKG